MDMLINDSGNILASNILPMVNPGTLQLLLLCESKENHFYVSLSHLPYRIG